MATTIETGYVYIVKGGTVTSDTISGSEGSSGSGTSATGVVKIHVGGNLTHNFANDIFFFPTPTTAYTPVPRVLNLGKVKEAVTVTGKLISIHNNVEENRTALEKKTDLLVLAKGQQPCTFVSGTVAGGNQREIYTDFNINKIQFKVLPTTPYATFNSNDVIQTIEVTLQGLLGESMT